MHISFPVNPITIGELRATWRKYGTDDNCNGSISALDANRVGVALLNAKCECDRAKAGVFFQLASAMADPQATSFFGSDGEMNFNGEAQALARLGGSRNSRTIDGADFFMLY